MDVLTHQSCTGIKPYMNVSPHATQVPHQVCFPTRNVGDRASSGPSYRGLLNASVSHCEVQAAHTSEHSRNFEESLKQHSLNSARARVQ